ncbi:MAG: CocE/NonD family hydrolase [Halobacteriaceae archaeon]
MTDDDGSDAAASETATADRDTDAAAGSEESAEAAHPPDTAVATPTHEAPDGVDLATRVFRPPAAEPVPVLLQRTPYGRPEELSEGSLPWLALESGYAVVFEDTRGRGQSGGAFEPWVHEAADGAATVEWLADRPWSTGDVGMFGGSSPGHVQLFAAAEQPDGLGAIAPLFTPSDLHRADFFQDGAMSAMTLLTWSLGPLAHHTVERLERAGRIDADAAERVVDALDESLERVPALASHRPLAEVHEHVLTDALPSDLDADDVVPHWTDWTERPTYDDVWRSFDPEVRYAEMDVPGLHVTGWYELCQSGTLANFAGMRDRTDADQHLVVGPWAHQDTGADLGERSFADAASADAYGWSATQLAFFDAYLRDGEPFGTAGDRVVETFRTDAGEGTWTAHDDWPPADAVRDRFYLDSCGRAATDPDDGALTRTPPAKATPPDTYVHDPTDPVPTRGGPLCCRDETAEPGPVDQRPVEDRDDVLTYTTPPLSSPVELAGPVSVDLTCATTANDTDFTAKLVDVFPDGPAYNLCEGIRRARFRHGRDRAVPVEPGTPMRLTVDCWHGHHRLPAGHRLRLEVASSNHPRFDPHPGTTDPWQAGPRDVERAEQTVYHEPDRASALHVTRRPVED